MKVNVTWRTPTNDIQGLLELALDAAVDCFNELATHAEGPDDKSVLIEEWEKQGELMQAELEGCYRVLRQIFAGEELPVEDIVMRLAMDLPFKIDLRMDE